MEDIKNALKQVRFPKFKIKFYGLGAFPSEKHIRVVWIGVESKELVELAKQVQRLLGNEERFVPHLTIARVKRKPLYLKEKLEKLKNIEIGEQVVDSFALKKSTLTPQGPIYEDLAVFGLGY